MDKIDDILDVNAEAIPYEDASLGLRFANNIIDSIFLQYGVGFVFEYGFLELAGNMAISNETYIILNALFWIIIMVLYYAFCEAYTGKTLGKLLTQTRVVTMQGEKPTFGQCIGRSFARMVPFEAFSFLGGEPRGWHDRWTKTRVVKEKK